VSRGDVALLPGLKADDANLSSRSRATERGLVRDAAGGDPSARGELVNRFLPLVASVARRYRGVGGVERGELMQEGVVGLLRALGRYDAERGTPFWSYASWWVRQAMQQHVAEMAKPVVLSDRALRELARVKAAQRRHQQDHGVQASNAQLAEETGVELDHVERLIAVERTPRPLDEPISHGDTGATPAERIADPRAADEFDSVTRRLEIGALRWNSAGLSRREREILRARYGLGQPVATLREVACELKVSAARVHQIERHALDKLRDAATGQDAG
jgi:RNA polymerase sigma factor (sigma-70 family)